MYPMVDFARAIMQIEKLNLGIDILKLKRMNNEIRLFYIHLITRPLELQPEKMKHRLSNTVKSLKKAEYHYYNCINMLKTEFELDWNPFIKEVNDITKCWEKFILNFGIANARIDAIFDKLHELERANEITKNVISRSWIATLTSSLREAMENFIIYPIINVVRIFQKPLKKTKTAKGEKDEIVTYEKTKDLFFYFLFKQLFAVSEIEGSIARLAVITSRTPQMNTKIENYKGPPLDYPGSASYKPFSETEESGEIDLSNLTAESLTGGADDVMVQPF